MICLHCKQEITEANRQRYKGGLRLPYCKPCTDAFNRRDKTSLTEEMVKTLSDAQKKKARKKATKALQKRLGLTREEAEAEVKKVL